MNNNKLKNTVSIIALIAAFNIPANIAHAIDECGIFTGTPISCDSMGGNAGIENTGVTYEDIDQDFELINEDGSEVEFINVSSGLLDLAQEVMVINNGTINNDGSVAANGISAVVSYIAPDNISTPADIVIESNIDPININPNSITSQLIGINAESIGMNSNSTDAGNGGMIRIVNETNIQSQIGGINAESIGGIFSNLYGNDNSNGGDGGGIIIYNYNANIYGNSGNGINAVSAGGNVFGLGQIGGDGGYGGNIYINAFDSGVDTTAGLISSNNMNGINAQSIGGDSEGIGANGGYGGDIIASISHGNVQGWLSAVTLESIGGSATSEGGIGGNAGDITLTNGSIDPSANSSLTGSEDVVVLNSIAGFGGEGEIDGDAGNITFDNYYLVESLVGDGNLIAANTFGSGSTESLNKIVNHNTGLLISNNANGISATASGQGYNNGLNGGNGTDVEVTQNGYIEVGDIDSAPVYAISATSIGGDGLDGGNGGNAGNINVITGADSQTIVYNGNGIIAESIAGFGGEGGVDGFSGYVSVQNAGSIEVYGGDGILVKSNGSDIPYEPNIDYEAGVSNTGTISTYDLLDENGNVIANGGHGIHIITDASDYTDENGNGLAVMDSDSSNWGTIDAAGHGVKIEVRGANAEIGGNAGIDDATIEFYNQENKSITADGTGIMALTNGGIGGTIIGSDFSVDGTGAGGDAANILIYNSGTIDAGTNGIDARSEGGDAFFFDSSADNLGGSLTATAGGDGNRIDVYNLASIYTSGMNGVSALSEGGTSIFTPGGSGGNIIINNYQDATIIAEGALSNGIKAISLGGGSIDGIGGDGGNVTINNAGAIYANIKGIFAKSEGASGNVGGGDAGNIVITNVGIISSAETNDSNDDGISEPLRYGIYAESIGGNGDIAEIGEAGTINITNTGTIGIMDNNGNPTVVVGIKATSESGNNLPGQNITINNSGTINAEIGVKATNSNGSTITFNNASGTVNSTTSVAILNGMTCTDSCTSNFAGDGNGGDVFASNSGIMRGSIDIESLGTGGKVEFVNEAGGLLDLSDGSSQVIGGEAAFVNGAGATISVNGGDGEYASASHVIDVIGTAGANNPTAFAPGNNGGVFTNNGTISLSDNKDIDDRLEINASAVELNGSLLADVALGSGGSIVGSDVLAINADQVSGTVAIGATALAGTIDTSALRFDGTEVQIIEINDQAENNLNVVEDGYLAAGIYELDLKVDDHGVSVYGTGEHSEHLDAYQGVISGSDQLVRLFNDNSGQYVKTNGKLTGWSKVSGSLKDVDDGNVKFKNKAIAVQLGGDIEFIDGVRLGVKTGHGQVKGDNYAIKALDTEIKGAMVGAYASYDRGAVNIDASISHTNLDMKTNIQGHHGNSYGDEFEGKAIAASLNAGYEINAGNGWEITPNVNLEHSSVGFDKFRDIYGAEVEVSQGNRTTVGTGVTIENNTSIPGFTPYARANIEKVIGGGDYEITANKTKFTLESDDILYGASVGAKLDLNKLGLRGSAFTELGHEAGDNSKESKIAAGLEFNF